MTDDTVDELGDAGAPDEADAAAPVAPAAPPTPLTRAQWARYAGVGLGFTMILLLPTYLTGHVWGYDWTTHLWMTWVQGHNVAAGAPSLFLHFNGMGVFFPYYAFYGGSWYTIGGSVMQIIGGDPLVGYAVMWTFAFFWAYLGLLWIGLQAGLRGWKAHAAPLVLVTAAYYLTDAFARGAYGEFTAMSAVPMVIASTAYLLRAETIRVVPAAGLIWSTMMFTSAHNISLSWGTVFLACVALITLVALPRHGCELRLGRVAAVAALGALGIAANMWYLLPDLVYAKRTTIANGWSFYKDDSSYFARWSILFDPLRKVPKESGTPGLYTNLPVLVILWALVSAWVIGRRAARPLRRAICGFMLLGGVLTLLLRNFAWDHIPRTLQFIQFSYRLQSYILIALALATVFLLVAAQRSPRGRRFTRALVPILAFGFVLALYQGWATKDMTGTHRQDTFKGGDHTAPPTWYDPGSYRDATAKVVPTTPDRVLTVPPEQVSKDRFDGQVQIPAGPGPIETNIAGGDYVVKVTGPVRQVGRDPLGNMVVEKVDPNAPGGTVQLHIEPAHSFPIVAGRRISLLAILGIVAVLIWLGVRQRAASRAANDAAVAPADPPPV